MYITTVSESRVRIPEAYREEVDGTANSTGAVARHPLKRVRFLG